MDTRDLSMVQFSARIEEQMTDPTIVVEVLPENMDKSKKSQQGRFAEFESILRL